MYNVETRRVEGADIKTGKMGDESGGRIIISVEHCAIPVSCSRYLIVFKIHVEEYFNFSVLGMPSFLIPCRIRKFRNDGNDDDECKLDPTQQCQSDSMLQEKNVQGRPGQYEEIGDRRNQ